jgi:hypothetical protein
MPEFNFEDLNGIRIHPFGDENEDLIGKNPSGSTIKKLF